MLKQIKRARDRFFGTGEADTSVPVLDGPLKPNHLLESAEVFYQAQDLDDLCVTGDGRLVLSCGSQLLVVDAGGSAQLLASFEQTIQAVATYRDGVIVAVDGSLRVVGGHLDGKHYALSQRSPVTGITALCEHPDGSIIISEGSRQHRPQDWSRDLLTDGASGRVLQYIPDTHQLKVLAQGLRYAYGALVDADGQIYTSESWAHRLIRVGEQLKPQPVYHDFPGYPSRLIRASAGGYWLTVFAPRNQLVEFVLRETAFKYDMMEKVAPEYWIAPALSSGKDFIEPLQQGGVRQMGILKPWAPARSYGLVVRLDAEFQPLYSMHSRVGGQHHGVTAVAEFNHRLLVLSKGAGKVLSLPLSDTK